MGQRDPRIDRYIQAAQPFAQPILKHLRQLVHQANANVGETIKWGMPHFTLDGKNLGGMGAFKAHAAFFLWRGADELLDKNGDDKGMGQFGRITSLADLPSDKKLLAYIKQAADLRLAGVKVERKKRPAPRPPADLAAALKRNAKAAATFKALRPSHKREYVDWLKEAKTQPTRERRLAQALALLGQGKSRYGKVKTKG